MKRFAQCALAVAALCLQMGTAGAQEVAPPAVQRPIPYKTEPAPVEEQGLRTGLVLALLLLATGIGLIVVRKRVPRLVGIDSQGGRLRVKERIRLSPRGTVYLIRLDGRELLVAQCGEHITQLDIHRGAPSPENPSEAGHG